MNVKVCGITRLQDAQVAADLGAWAIGFIFHRKSPRYISPDDAFRIGERLRPDLLKVGVFVDYPLDTLNEVVSRAGLDGAQLHGDESVEYAAAVDASLVVKVFRVGTGFDPDSVTSFSEHSILLDTYQKDLYGGTGEVVDWSVARSVGDRSSFILSGGLNPDNVAEGIRASRPAAVDVSSGVEVRPGIKDSGKLHEFFEAVLGAETL